MKFDVCLETVFPELAVEERIANIALAGYDCVEMWFPDGRDSAAIRQACAVLQWIEASSYNGCFGLEYFPQISDHMASLRETRVYLHSAFSEIA